MLTLMEDDVKSSESSRYPKNKGFRLGVENEGQYPSTFYHTPPNYGDEQFLNDDPLLSSTNEVESTLDNPTPYHLKENERRQIQQYMSTQLPSNPQSTMLSPSRLSPKSMTPDTPLSPDDMNVNFGNFEIDSIFERITLPESKDQDQQMNIEIPINSLPSSYTFSNTVPPQQPVFTYYPESPSTPNFSMLPNPQQHMSCPAHLGIHKPGDSFGDEMKQYSKDRQKKDNHNAIERRRRFNINDRIKELGTLLPKQDPEIRPNKGTILKCSVDYIEALQSDQIQWYKQRDVLSARIAQLENCLRKHAISETEWGPATDKSVFAHQTYPVKIKREPDTSFYTD